MIGLGAVAMRALVVRRGIVGLVEVCIVMRLRVEGVIAAVALGMRIVVVVVVVGPVGNVFYRILAVVSPTQRRHSSRKLTLGCNCSLSPGVPGPGPGPIGISRGPGCEPYLSSSW